MRPVFFQHHKQLKQLTVLTAGIFFLLFAFSTTAQIKTPPAAAIASAHPVATAAGHEILAAGGNAFDAAVAVSATLAVVEPYSSGIGGGGFWLLHRASDGFQTMIDGRERAPLAARADMYLDDNGKVIKGLSRNGPLAAGIPGEPAALVYIAEHYGQLPLSKSLAPAIRAAHDGFTVDERYRKLVGFRLDAMQTNPESARIFLDHNAIPPLGYLIKQPDLARTLKAIATKGHAGFYSGEIAEKLVAAVRQAGGIWKQRDLSEYTVVERTPIRGEYKGIRITSAAPPSSGGIALLTMLNIIAGYDLDKFDDTTRTHLIVEAMRRAYRDRAEYLGDPDFVDIPTAQLTSPFYAAGLRNSIRLDRATPSNSLPGVNDDSPGRDTTHFSIIDQEGNRVSATLSINFPFGATFIPPETGVVLNNEMDDFSAKPAVPNGYGLVGAEANAIAPGKRPLSSMTPTFLETKDRVALLGTPGGSRIITMVLLGTLEFAAGKPPEDWVSRGRFHHQFLPDMIQFEPGALDNKIQDGLKSLGHQLKMMSRQYGNMQAILWDKQHNRLDAASDPRGIGTAEVIEH